MFETHKMYNMLGSRIKNSHIIFLALLGILTAITGYTCEVATFTVFKCKEAFLLNFYSQSGYLE